MTSAEAEAMLSELDAALERLESDFEVMHMLLEKDKTLPIVELEKLVVRAQMEVAAAVGSHLVEEDFMVIAKEAWVRRRSVNAAGGNG